MPAVTNRHFFAEGTYVHLDPEKVPSSSEATNERVSPRVLEIKSCLDKLTEAFQANELDFLDDGGLPVTDPAREFLLNSAASFINMILLNRQYYSIEDFLITPFARDDGGACLLIDYLKQKRRISLIVRPSGLGNRMTFSCAEEAPSGEEIQFPDEIATAESFAWLTNGR
ncbi:MAG: hypothetical protein ABJA67_16520 [Chthonomonadales bacterium]